MDGGTDGPRCPILDRCGGCPLQAVPYQEQLDRKRAALLEKLAARPALASIPVEPVEGLAEPYGFRTKIQLVAGGAPGDLVIGLYRPGTHEIVDTRGCVVQHVEGNRIVDAVRAILEHARVAPYDERLHDGIVRHVLVRVDGGGRRAAVTLVCREGRFPGRDAVAQAIAAIPSVTGVYLNVQSRPGSTVLGDRTYRLAGRSRLHLDVAGMRFLLSPTAFFQTSGPGVEMLVARVRALLPGPYRSVLDLYCGAGVLARALADRSQRVVGVEENAAAIADAEASLRFAGIGEDEDEDEPPEEHEQARRERGALREGRGERGGEVTFLALPAEMYIEHCRERFDAVVVDPPRSGLDPGVLTGIARTLRPARLVYVSCHLRTFVRDLERLAAAGYATRAVHPIDMFPHTEHLECVAVLEPSGDGAS